MRRAESSGPKSLPRMAPRYQSRATDVTLHVRNPGLLQRRRTLRCELADLSIDGALVVLPSNATVQRGIRVELSIAGERATVGVRHVNQGRDGRLRCGVSFRTASPGFTAVVNDSIAAAITDPRRNDAWRMNG